MSLPCTSRKEVHAMTGNIRGGQAKLIIKKKTVNFPPQKIEKESEGDAQTPKPDHAIQLKLGLRLKQAQQIEPLELRPACCGLMARQLQFLDQIIGQDLCSTN